MEFDPGVYKSHYNAMCNIFVLFLHVVYNYNVYALLLSITHMYFFFFGGGEGVSYRLLVETVKFPKIYVDK